MLRVFWALCVFVGGISRVVSSLVIMLPNSIKPCKSKKKNLEKKLHLASIVNILCITTALT